MQRTEKQSPVIGLCLFLGLAVSTSAAAPLDATLPPVLKSHRGRVAVAVKHLKTGVEFEYRATERMPTASLIKLPVMIEAYRQAAEDKIDLDAMVTLRDQDKVPGSGILTPHFSAGTHISLRDAVRLMIAYSDNTATNLVLDRIGIKSTADTMDKLGFSNTKIHAKVFRRDTSVFPQRSEEFGLGSTTAAEMVGLLEQLHQGKLGDEAASKEMVDHLLCCQDKTRFPRPLPPGTKIAHKTGSVSRVRCDAGIIYSPSGPIALCVLTAENQDQRWVDDNDANRLCARVAKIVYDHFNPPRALDTSDRATLKVGAGGRLVEDLQRTLNARLDPPPELAVDGDFGPATRAAVVRFQEANKLKANGVVDESAWKALGTLIASDPPVPAPEIVNQEELPTSKADALTGPPNVTCKAWAIADGKTGELLWGNNEDEPRDFASTTKIMTAFVVLNLAKDSPEILDEMVAFSERADQTGGTSARVRAGEKLSVRELLYGLLLPSGNDASVALAEHFGGRFGPPEDHSDEQDPLARFVAEMNRAAATLGMNKTSYRNPHGLTAEGHSTSARDLLELAHAALRLPRFGEYVGTRQRGCTLVGPGGYRRNVAWKNTNRLLSIDGYHGVKTGTTSAAGACLVSSGHRGDDQLLVVVLGSTSSDARYVDTRNLFRWSWRQRAKK
ncbi:MAG: serine hydrolase [Planctomycetota bacterium]